MESGMPCIQRICRGLGTRAFASTSRVSAGYYWIINTFRAWTAAVFWEHISLLLDNYSILYTNVSATGHDRGIFRQSADSEIRDYPAI